jgi:hypothetical protein
MEAIDRDYQEYQKNEVTILKKEQEKILMSLEAYETTTIKKVDQKSEKLIDYYTKQITEANAVLERAQKKRDDYVEMCNKEIQRLGGGTPQEDPERIIRMKLRLSQIESSLKLKGMFLSNFEMEIKKPNPPRRMTKQEWQAIPISEEVLKAEKELELAKNNYKKFGVES